MFLNSVLMTILCSLSKTDFVCKYFKGGVIVHFPGTNLQDLNLDWLVQKVKELEERVERLEEQLNDNP